MVKISASRAGDLGLIPAFAVDLFQGLVIPSDLETGTPVATLPGTLAS